jgi:hypothetical protein
MPKGKKIKVLMHRPRYIEMARVPKLVEGTPSTVEPRYPAPAGSKGESVEMPTVPATESAKAPKRPTEAKGKSTEEPELGELAELPKILSPLPEPKLPKVSKAPAITPKKRRMASVLDAVLESTRASTPAPAKEAAAATTIRAKVKARPSVPIETWPAETKQSIQLGPLGAALVLEEEDAPKKVESPTSKASTEETDFIIRHASGKKCRKRKLPKLNTMPGN